MEELRKEPEMAYRFFLSDSKMWQISSNLPIVSQKWLLQKYVLLLHEGLIGTKYRVFGISANDRGQLWKVTIDYHLFILREVNDLYILEDV